jgi:hypothetical protein
MRTVDVDGSTSLVKAAWPSIAKAVARSREHFPFGASWNDGLKAYAPAEIDAALVFAE